MAGHQLMHQRKDSLRLGFLGVAAAPACFSRSTTMEGSEEHVEKYPTEPVDGAYRASLQELAGRIT
jgi:hypothetical protein